MPAVKLYAFGGMIPAIDDRLLPEHSAAFAENTWLYQGVIAGMFQPTLLRALTSSTATKVYRLEPSSRGSDHLADSDNVWLEHQNADTDTIKSSVVGDSFERYYWASPADVPRVNSRARIAAGNSGGNAPYKLGIPAPGTPPVINPTGGTSLVNRTTSYVYTWVSVWGEEGPPSAPTTATNKIDASWDLTLTAPVADDQDGPDRDLDTVRIYRTVVGSDGTATYFFVAEQAVTDTTYSDTATDATVSLNNLLESTYWTAPPTDLQGWVSMPNGIVAAWRENEIWFSEPFRPHAWPESYAIAVDYPIVGLGVVGQSIVVCTQGYPSTVTGIHPSTMRQAQLMNLEPCMSRGSILSSPEGVYYASPNGLVLVANGVARNITKDLTTKQRWNELVSQATLTTLYAARLGGAYYAFGTARTGVFQADTFQVSGPQAFATQDFTGALNGVLIDPTNERVAFTLLSDDDVRTMSVNDPWTGELLLIYGGNLYWVDVGDTTPTYEVFTWKSKVFHPPEVKNLSAFKVDFDTLSTTPAQNPVRNTASPQVLAADQYGLVRVYSGDSPSTLTLRTTREIRTSGELMRIPSGYKHNYWQFEIEARVRVTSLQFATSPRELAGV